MRHEIENGRTLGLENVSPNGNAARDYSGMTGAILGHASDVITVIAADGEILYESPSVRRILGYDPEELVGRNITEILHPDDRASGAETLGRLMSSPGITPAVVFRWRHRDGTWRLLESIGNNLLEDPAIGAMVSVSRDVTNHEARGRLHGLEGPSRVEGFPASTFVTRPDPDSPVGVRFDYVGPESEAMFGYSPEEFYADPSLGYSMTHPEDRAKVMAAYAGAGTDVFGGSSTGDGFDGRRPVAFECRVTTASGETRWTRVHATVRSRPEGRLVEGVISDITESRRDGERAFEAERRYGSAFESASCGLALSGVDLRVICANQSLCEMLGYEQEELVGRRMLELTHPDDIPASDDRIRRLVSGERSSMRLEKRYLRKDGEVVWTISDSSLVRDPDGEPSFFVVSYQDISEQKEIERRLRQSEERFRALVHKSSEMVKVVDLDGTLRYASPALKTLLGYDPEESVGEMNVIDHVHPDDRAALARLTAEALERQEARPDEEVYNVAEYRFRHADGSWRHVESVGTYLLSHPAIKGVVINTRDVTERREAEARLRQSEEKHRSLVETVREVIFQCDPEGRLIYLNPAWERVMGYSAEESLGKFPEDFLVQENPVVKAQIPSASAASEGELTLRTKAGRLRIFEVSFAVEPSDSVPEDGRHRYSGAYGSLHDITERKELERELELQALHDSLTDLPNRRFLMRQLEDALESPLRGEVALLFVDIDDFKVVNDSMGHEVGDLVLKAAAGRISHSVREVDLVSRLGGEEFVVLMEDVDRDTASAVAERVLRAFAPAFSTGANCNGAEIEVDVSIGVTLNRGNGGDLKDVSATELLREADLAMYRAKQDGGSCWRAG